MEQKKETLNNWLVSWLVSLGILLGTGLSLPSSGQAVT